MDYLRSKKDVLTAYPAEELADILGVSLRTAQRYQSGESRPPEGLINYLWLVFHNRVMPDSWPQHVRFQGDEITGFDTNRRINWASIGQFDWIMNQWSATCDRLLELEVEIKDLRRRNDLSNREQEALKVAHDDLRKRRDAQWHKNNAPSWFRQTGC